MAVVASTLADRLVRDRLAEFKALAQSKNKLAGSEARSQFRSERSFQNLSGKLQTPPCAGAGFMREFFESTSEIQSTLDKGRANVSLMGEVLVEALQATTTDRQRAVSDRLQSLVEETNGHVASVKRDLEQLKEASESPDSQKARSASELKIRSNMEQALAKKHQKLLMDFQQKQVEFKRALESRQAREMAILVPDATDEERAQMIGQGETCSLIIAKKVAGAHALLLDEVQRIREKHQDILNLERSIADLAQMFQEIAVLVDSQGDMLNAIEAHVHTTKENTAKAEKNLKTARKSQLKAKKWMCCLTVLMFVLVILIVGPILIAEGR